MYKHLWRTLLLLVALTSPWISTPYVQAQSADTGLAFKDSGNLLAQCNAKRCIGMMPTAQPHVQSLAYTAKHAHGSNSQIVIPQNLLLADIDVDGASDFVQYVGNKLFVSKTDFEQTDILHLYMHSPIKRVLTGDFYGLRYDQVCIVTDDNALACFGTSPDRHELWWAFTQDAFFNDNEDMIVGDFDGNGRDDVLVYPHDGGTFRMYSIAGDFFFEPVPTFSQGNLEGIDRRSLQVRAGDFTEDGRDDLMLVNRGGQVLFYGSVFDGANNTFWWGFTTNSDFVGRDDQVSVARIDDNAIDDVVLRNRITGATRFFHMDWADGVLPPITNVAIGQLNVTGNSMLFWGFMHPDWPEPGSQNRDDAMVYDLTTDMLIRSDARWDGSGLTYWWAYTQWAPSGHVFRPNPDGYSFANYGGVNMADYTIDDMRRSFGDSAVCASILNGRCVARSAAQQWNTWANQIMDGGHCYGMAITSLRFFKGLDNPSAFQNGATTPYALQQANARRNIAYYFVRQLTDPASRSWHQGLQKTPAEVLGALRGVMSDSAPDPAILVIFQSNEGHAITPYAIEDQGNSIFWIKVYDNNWPNDANRHVELNTATNTWSYDLGWVTWSGNASTHSIGIEQISNDGVQPDCPWCQQSEVNRTATSQIWSMGKGNLLVVDDQGRRVGNVGGQVVAEIPGAYVLPVIGGLGKAQSIYSVPLNGTHTLLIDGQTLTQTVTTAVAQFGPGYAVTADGIALKPAAQGKFTVTADGREATYQASDTTSVNLTLALDSLSGSAAASNATEGAGASYTFRMTNVDVGGNQSVKATVDAQSGVVALRNEQTGGGSYDLQITRGSSTGEQSFAHAAIAVTAGDTQYIDYASWNGSGGIVVKIDHGSDGSIDQTSTLANTAYRVYLPITIR